MNLSLIVLEKESGRVRVRQHLGIVDERSPLGITYAISDVKRMIPPLNRQVHILPLIELVEALQDQQALPTQLDPLLPRTQTAPPRYAEWARLAQVSVKVLETVFDIEVEVALLGPDKSETF